MNKPLILQPIVVICGEPGMGKTTDVSGALALSSRMANLFANQVFIPKID